jgi:hypothetical protein
MQPTRGLILVRMSDEAARDLYGLRLTASPAAAAAYNRGVRNLLRVRSGALTHLAEAVALDPTFALGHSALALLGHEFCAPVDVGARLRAAQLHARRGDERERSHAYAVDRHIAGDSAPLIVHLQMYPRDALLLSVAVPTIAFAGVTQVPAESWAIVERAQPAYGDDWWYTGLLAFIRQEQRRWDEAMALACRSLTVDPTAGHSVHARTHVHYETGDHEAGLSWLDDWITANRMTTDNLSHFSWHAALHELSNGDFEGLRARYADQLAPDHVDGCRALVDSCSLLWRWTITPDAADVPGIHEPMRTVGHQLLHAPPTAFVALHSAVALCAAGDVEGLEELGRWASRHADSTYSEVVSPLAAALRLLSDGRPGPAADQLAALRGVLWRVGGSDAQREVIEDTEIAALLAAGRCAEACVLIDRRLDRRHCRRDESYRELAAAGIHV